MPPSDDGVFCLTEAYANPNVKTQSESERQAWRRCLIDVTLSSIRLRWVEEIKPVNWWIMVVANEQKTMSVGGNKNLLWRLTFSTCIIFSLLFDQSNESRLRRGIVGYITFLSIIIISHNNYPLLYYKSLSLSVSCSVSAESFS